MADIKTQHKMSHAAFSDLLQLLQQLDMVPSEVKTKWPNSYYGLLAILMALGVAPPKLYVYDMCQRCNHIFRCALDCFPDTY